MTMGTGKEKVLPRPGRLSTHPPVGLHDRPGDGEAEAGSQACGTLGLPEGVKETLKVGRRDSRAGVVDREADVFTLDRRAHLDHALVRRELDHISEQVTEDL